jgi:hypothetical protein
VFDAWIREYVETIINVNTFLWDIFDRWQIVNAVLEGKFLVLMDQEDGTFFLCCLQKQKEVFSSIDGGTEEKTSQGEAEIEASPSREMASQA